MRWYDRAMELPFTTDQFFAVFARYNAAVWPAQIVAYPLGMAAVGALWMDTPLGRRLILSGLALSWAWNGIAYHLLHFAPVNPAARVFAALFVLQAILLAGTAALPRDLRFAAGADLRTALGLGLIAYAMLVYEVLGYWSGHGLMTGPLFGVAPCPTTIFTIGILLLMRGAPRAWLSVIPVIWAVIGSTGAVLLNVPEDFGLAIAAALLVGVLAADAIGRPRPR